MSELLKRAIKTLSICVNVSTGVTHPFDNARAKELFKALRAEGESLAYDEVRGLALENNWSERHADELAQLAQHIGAGGRVVIKQPRHWGKSAVARLKREICTEDPTGHSN